MRKVIFGGANSLDNFIARKDRSTGFYGAKRLISSWRTSGRTLTPL
jgi:hypothetical protein